MSGRTTRHSNKTAKVFENHKREMEPRSGSNKSVAEQETEISKPKKLPESDSPLPPPQPPRSRPSSPVCNETPKGREEGEKRSGYVNALFH